MRDISDRPQHVNGSDHQGTPGGGDDKPRQWPAKPQRARALPRKIREAGQTATRKRRHHERRANEGKLPQKSAELFHLQSAGVLKKISAQGERQRREQAMGDHHQHGAGYPDQTQARDSQEGEAHVRHAGIANEQVQVTLAHRYPAYGDDVTQAKERQHAKPILRSLRHERQRNSNQPIQTKLFQNTRVEHRGGRGRGAVTDGRPGVKGPEGDEDAKTEQQQRKHEVLGAWRHGIALKEFRQLWNAEADLIPARRASGTCK